MTALWQPIAVQASPFFDFLKDAIIDGGYGDNLFLIQDSPGEFTAEDILWMIDNDCLDVAGAQWCVDAGLIPADAMSRPALQEPKTKPQVVYGHGESSGGGQSQNQPQQTPPPAEEKPVVQPTVQEAPQEEQKGSSDNDAGQDAQQTPPPAEEKPVVQPTVQEASQAEKQETVMQIQETAETETESETETIIEIETESEIETETEIMTETESEIETVSETETITATETETDIEQPSIRLPVFIGGVLIVALLGLVVLLKKKRN